jgi:hypothetical protein
MQSPQEKAMKAHMSWYFFFFPEWVYKVPVGWWLLL